MRHPYPAGGYDGDDRFQVKPFEPRRGDVVEAWIKRARDDFQKEAAPGATAWHVLDDLLNDYREHADTGTPLSENVEGPHGDGS